MTVYYPIVLESSRIDILLDPLQAFAHEVPPVVRSRAFRFPLLPLEQLARLAIEFPAQGVERGKADGAGLVRFQHRQVRDGDADAVGQIGQREAAVEEKVIEIDAYSHFAASDRQRLVFIETSPCPEDLRDHQNDQAVDDRNDVDVRPCIELQTGGGEMGHGVGVLEEHHR